MICLNEAIEETPTRRWEQIKFSKTFYEISWPFALQVFSNFSTCSTHLSVLWMSADQDLKKLWPNSSNDRQIRSMLLVSLIVKFLECRQGSYSKYCSILNVSNVGTFATKRKWDEAFLPYRTIRYADVTITSIWYVCVIKRHVSSSAQHFQ